LADLLPNVAGAWTNATADGFILPEDTAPEDVYDQVLTRAYAAPGLPPVMLLVAYGSAQSGLMKVHRPEVCYSAAGFAISDNHQTEVKLAPGKTVAAREFLGKREDRAERVLYWTRISNRFPTSLTEQRVIMIERGMQGVIPDGVLVRLSTLAPTSAVADAALLGFASALYASANGALRSLLVGEN
jgi:EpsI family protein